MNVSHDANRMGAVCIGPIKDMQQQPARWGLTQIFFFILKSAKLYDKIKKKKCNGYYWFIVLTKLLSF